MLSEIFIAGASARSATQSAVRAGLRVTAADLFCDRDLADCCQPWLVDDFPTGILAISETISPKTWVYTGGLENVPELVDAVSCRHELLGNPGSVLRRVRDPWQVAPALHSAQLPYPDIRWRPPRDRHVAWVCKPIRSCGGMHIKLHRDEGSQPATNTGREIECDSAAVMSGDHNGGDGPSGRFYYQRLLDGLPHGAVYIASQGKATLLGVTRQLAGSRWAGASGYRYVGSIGPVDCAPRTWDEFVRIGDCLAQAFGLRGLFGVDAIVSRDQVWTIEVNPRFTASVEVIERATGLAAMRMHHSVCLGGVLPEHVGNHTGKLYGKAIAYAQRACVICETFYRRLATPLAGAEHTEFADLPRVGTKISAGHPILTVFADGHDLHEVYCRLQAKVRAIHVMCG